MDKDSEYSSSESEENIVIESIDPTIEDPFPLQLNSQQYTPPLSVLKLTSSAKSDLEYILSLSSTHQIRKLLFWQIFYKKFKNDSTAALQKRSSKALGKEYVKLLWINLKKKLGSALEQLPLVMGYSVHHELYDLFKFSRHLLDVRFNLDCYKIIYQELLGITVSDSFIQTSAKKLFGDYFLKYTRKTKKETNITSNVHTKKMERQMEGIPGGVEFAKELYFKIRPVANKIENVILDDTSKVQISDSAIVEKVKRQFSQQLLRPSEILDRTKSFNCVKLGPLISHQTHSSSVLYM